MLTINEAIARFEANAEQNERWASGGLNPEANAEYAAEHRQLAEWLRELQERRKEPEIIHCTECKHYREYDSKYVKNAVVVQCMADRYPISEIIPDGWFCAGAERRTDEMQ